MTLKNNNPGQEPLGIWAVEHRKDYSSYLAKYPEPKGVGKQVKKKAARKAAAQPKTQPRMPVAKVAKPRKRWGLPLVAVSVIVFLVAQLVISLVLLGGYILSYLVQHSTSLDQAGLEAALTALLSNTTVFMSLLNGFYTWLQVTPWALYTVQAFLYGPWIVFMLYATYRKGLKSFRKEFWLSFKKWDLPLGVAIAVGLTALELLIQFLLSLIPGVNLAGSDNGAILFKSAGIWLYVTTFGLGGIVGPFFEELYFRGFVMQGFIRYFRKGLRTRANTRMGANIQAHAPGLYRGYLKFKLWLYHHKYAISVILTGIFFGLMHTQLPSDGSAITAGEILVPVVTGGIGMVLGFIAIRTRRLGMNIFTHMAFNTLGVALAFLPINFF